ncbi:MAG: hypothetical protein ACLFWD_02425, partial [Anaerolineales bacterium]
MRKRVFLLLSVLLTAAMACSLPGGQSGTAEPKSAETSVAATLTAIGAAGEQPTGPPATGQPGEETPAPPAGEPTE